MSVWLNIFMQTLFCFLEYNTHFAKQKDASAARQNITGFTAHVNSWGKPKNLIYENYKRQIILPLVLVMYEFYYSFIASKFF